MDKFEYFVKDSAGRDKKGIQEAPDVASLVSDFHNQGYVVVHIEKIKPKNSFFAITSSQEAKKKKKIKLDQIVIFSRQLATMINAGVPLVQSLDVLSDQMENPAFKEVIRRLKVNVEGGKSFSESLELEKKTFSPLFINMVRAGESSGKLDEILDRLSAYLEKTDHLIKRVQSAMIYPSVVTSVALIITYSMFTFVIPKFAEIFTQLQAKLPWPTALAIGISHFFQENSLMIVSSVVLMVFGIRMLIKTPAGRFWFDTRLLELPVFGPLFIKVAISKFSRTLSTLVKSGVPILSSLEIVAKTAGNKQIENVVNELRNSIKEGGGIAGPLTKSRYFPPMVTRMIAVGEETGEMEQMLGKIADFYDEQVDVAVQGMTALIEPLIIVFLGVVIGGIVIAMFLPILTMTQLLH